ncbi:MAG TPA: prepilin-type N-terminal cleavage/methylation domain-containing protein [Candidatus Saccharimonadales bacterium]|jgi:prepilin-type N-terminal cleavage/methylation domain-containing protein|nr:prepilin-type N-terminal cleavage/methylation domain-containing protein [Candidatus Saccharimonadales bacterium]
MIWKIRNGYTLIEILVALTIIGLLFSFGYVSFRDYSRRQAVSDAVKTIQGDLRLAEGDAITGQKPTGCNTTLDTFSFTIVSQWEYKIEGNCGITTIPVKDVILPSGITISTPPALQFKVLGQGTNIVGASWVITVSQTGTTNTGKVTVTTGGDIQ